MISKKQLRFAQKAVRKGWVSGERMLECIDFLNSGVKGSEAGLNEILMREGALSHAQIREIEKELSQYSLQDASGKPIRKLGNYELLEKLGEGAMGVVYKARKLPENKIVALKLLDQELGQDQEFINRFLGEARNAAKLRNHDNIVEGYDFGTHEGQYYFVMEFVEGRCLAEILYSQGRIPERMALSITRQVACALNHAHKFSIVHRDVKPENIMISMEGVVKLCDLGLAKDLSQHLPKSGGLSLGTVYYASPEQASGSKDVDTRADIYSLGITLYHMLTGEVPFGDTNTTRVAYRQIHEDLPSIDGKLPLLSRQTTALIWKMTSKKPERRCQSPQEVIEEIDSILVGRPMPEKRAAEAPPSSGIVLRKRILTRPPSRYLYPALTAALALLAAAVCLCWLFVE